MSNELLTKDIYTCENPTDLIIVGGFPANGIDPKHKAVTIFFYDDFAPNKVFINGEDIEPLMFETCGMFSIFTYKDFIDMVKERKANGDSDDDFVAFLESIDDGATECLALPAFKGTIKFGVEIHDDKNPPNFFGETTNDFEWFYDTDAEDNDLDTMIYSQLVKKGIEPGHGFINLVCEGNVFNKFHGLDKLQLYLKTKF